MRQARPTVRKPATTRAARPHGRSRGNITPCATYRVQEEWRDQRMRGRCAVAVENKPTLRGRAHALHGARVSLNRQQPVGAITPPGSGGPWQLVVLWQSGRGSDGGGAVQHSRGLQAPAHRPARLPARGAVGVRGPTGRGRVGLLVAGCVAGTAGYHAITPHLPLERIPHTCQGNCRGSAVNCLPRCAVRKPGPLAYYVPPSRRRNLGSPNDCNARACPPGGVPPCPAAPADQRWLENPPVKGDWLGPIPDRSCERNRRRSFP